jgi:hypothetical protein
MWLEDTNSKTPEGPIMTEQCRMWMTYTETKQMAIPHQGKRILSSHGSSSPACRKTFIQKGRQGVHLWRISNGIVCAIENLRGMRLPLVQGTDARECVLPAL